MAVPFAPGTNSLTFNIPNDALAGPTFARLRLSTGGGLQPFGGAADGEVEDYVVTIANPIAFGPQQILNTPSDYSKLEWNLSGPESVFAVDVDQDGDMDVVGEIIRSAPTGWHQQLGWYENDGTQHFTTHAVGPAGYAATSEIVRAADFDRDGDIDLIASRGSQISWYRNDGLQNFTQQVIATGDSDGWLAGGFSIVDMDGDGDLDVVTGRWSASRIEWYENDGNQNFTRRTVATFNATSELIVVDLDRDGDIDVVALGANLNPHAWFENDGTQHFTAHPLSLSAGGNLVAVDLEGHGDVDLLKGNNWYENDGHENFTSHRLSTLLNDMVALNDYAVDAADLDGDGDLDVLTTSNIDGKIAWYENDGQQNFTAHSVSVLPAGYFVSIIVADMDGDGDLDVLSTADDDHQIAWYENINTD